MNGALLWIAGLIVALLAALFAVPYAVDWNGYRGVFEEQASRMLDREVRIGGDVSLRLLPVPYVRFEKPRIADAEYGEALFRADSFTMWLDLPSLVQGILEAKQVELERPILRLQVEEDGGGNWRNFRVQEAALPFVPRGVALQSVHINEGVLAVHDVVGQPLTRIEIANGELSAPALEGPYRVRADVRWNGEVREVRMSTAAPDPDGSTRLKVTVRAPESGNSYTFDGSAVNLFDRPQFDGNLTAVIPISSNRDGLRPTTVEGDEQPSLPAGSLSRGVFEIRATVNANAVSAKLSDIAFSFEQNGQPQLLTGTAEVSWHDRPVVRASLASRWLDLDRIADVAPETNALAAIRNLTASVVEFLPTQAEVAAKLSIDQANLAGDVISDLTVSIENTGDGLAIKQLQAALPGSSRVELAGSLTGSGTAEAFDGEILLRGGNFNRFISWAARGTPFAEARSDAGFSFSGNLKLGRERLELTNASVDTGPNRLNCDVSYQWDGRRKLVISLETGHADVSGVLPGSLGPDLLKANLGALAGADPGSGLSELAAGLAEADIRLRVRADALTDGTRVLHNVDADVAIENGNLSIPNLRASTPQGFKLEIDGTVHDFANRATGSLFGVIEASTPTALAEALNIGASELDPGKRQWLAALAPLRLAFMMRFGQRDGTVAEITIDGTAHSKPLVASLHLAGGIEGWRGAPVDVLLTSDSPEVARIARGLLLGGRDVDQTDTGAPADGRLVLKAIGTPERETAVHLQFIQEGLRLFLHGRGSLPANADPKFDGEMEIAAASTASALRLAGLPLPAQAMEGGLNGKLGLTAGDSSLTLALSPLEMGGTQLTGEVRLSGSESAREMDLDLKANSVSLPGILALALDGSIDGLVIRDLAEITDWRDRPFDFSNLEHISGRIKLEADTLALGESFALSDAVIEAVLEPGRVTITKLEGQALGGAVSGAFKLEKTTAGGQISGAFGLWNLRLDQIKGASDAPLGAGSLQLSLELSGQAITPRALLPVLTGKGELELKSARWERLSPRAIEKAADAMLSSSNGEATAEHLQQLLRTALASEPLSLGDLKVPAEIGAGALKVGTFSIETPEAQVTNQTTVDLAEQKIDIEWKLQPKLPRGTRAPLPGISVIYVGPVQSLGSLEPQLVMDALERELAVRKMERDVEHLERLRREDEARARAEAERLKRLEEERLRQLEEQRMRRLEELQGAGAQGLTIDVPFPFPTSPPLLNPTPQQMTVEPDRAPSSSRTVIPPAAPKQWEGQWPRPSRSGS